MQHIDIIDKLMQYGFAVVVALLMIYIIWALGNRVIVGYERITSEHRVCLERMQDEHKTERDFLHAEHKEEREACYLKHEELFQRMDTALERIADKLPRMA